jgi:hypothetical protein
VEKLTKENLQLADELTRKSNHLEILRVDYVEREQIYSTEKIQYEKHIKELTKRPIMTSIKLQTVNYY